MKTVFFLVTVAAHALAAGPVVKLSNAQYEGALDVQTNISTFLGIRFAAAPTGDLRWRAPTSPPVLSGIQQATTQPPQCYQSSFGLNLTGNPLLDSRDVADPTTSEDCLFLNVHTPSLTPKELLPTIVWIHGGGYEFGSGDYNGSELVLESHRNVVAVIIQYRLGLFGFLAGQQVYDDGVTNAGLLDQYFALEWIAKFGGDPSKVTIWGESAGGGSVMQMALAYGGKANSPLFRAAITSSGYIPPTVSALAGCPNSTNLDCLRSTDVATLSAVNQNITVEQYQSTFPFQPVVDGTFIVKNPIIQLQEGAVNGEAYLAVTNTNEATRFVTATIEYDVAEFIRDLLPVLSVNQSKEAAEVYSKVGTSLEQVRAVFKEVNVFCPSYYTLEAYASKTAYKAQFAIPPALHIDDIPYYFGTSWPGFPAEDLLPTPRWNNTEFINAFAGSFLDFAVSLNPNEKVAPTITPEWPVWSAEGKQQMLFNRTDAAIPEPVVVVDQVNEALLERCEFWQKLRIQTSQ
ncbi:Carboxylic ester hydrolase [Mycena chlorophos]|uniref:Carboxylic ester hydrolase n=1 Tax=Mycena chlorophos TaxID=658473 RepID=A0A8H6T050_MYCCL|nr:Carboxylic ester hydrolase [Mycena chlorophos]